jgi:site-specific recombinase XerC
MHKARHTAGQRVLDSTGNLKAVQKLLGQLAATMTRVFTEDDDG